MNLGSVEIADVREILNHWKPTPEFASYSTALTSAKHSFVQSAWMSAHASESFGTKR